MAAKHGPDSNSMYLPGLELSQVVSPVEKKKKYVRTHKRVSIFKAWSDWNLLGYFQKSASYVTPQVDKSLDALPSCATMAPENAQAMLNAFPERYRRRRRLPD